MSLRLAPYGIGAKEGDRSSPPPSPGANGCTRLPEDLRCDPRAVGRQRCSHRGRNGAVDRRSENSDERRHPREHPQRNERNHRSRPCPSDTRPVGRCGDRGRRGRDAAASPLTNPNWGWSLIATGSSLRRSPRGVGVTILHDSVHDHRAGARDRAWLSCACRRTLAQRHVMDVHLGLPRNTGVRAVFLWANIIALYTTLSSGIPFGPSSDASTPRR